MCKIRAKVVCVLWNRGRMLLIRATDPHDGSTFLLPPGGGVEFGEKLADAIQREVREEVGLMLRHANSVGMLESMFHYAGRMEHELVFVYEANCDNEKLANSDEVEVTESNGEVFHAHWYTPSEIADTGVPIFPEGLIALLNLEDKR